MFGLFKKKKKEVDLGLTGPQIAFLDAITNALNNYPKFRKQFESGTFAFLGRNPGGASDSFTFGIYDNEWRALHDTTIDNHNIRNIKVQSLDGNLTLIDLYISEGLIIGFRCDLPIEKLNLNSIDISSIYEHYFLNNDLSQIKPFLKGIQKDKLSQLNLLSNAYKIRIADDEYVIVHDDKDGNYVGLNSQGNVFKLSHDPFAAIKLCNSLHDFLIVNQS